MLIGPHTSGPFPVHAVDELQSIAELGVVLFLFSVGLEMRPEKLWQMRRLIFGLGSAQMLLTAAVLAAYTILVLQAPWESATILGLAFAMSSTAIVMGTLGERGELASEHGRTTFAVLMAQDMWIVPIMALHVVIIGYDEVGQLMDLILERANIPHVAVERDIAVVQIARRAGREVYFGDLYSASTHEATKLGKAAAVFVTSRDSEAARRWP